MGATSWWHWLIVLAVVLLLFGGKKLPELMKGLGTGIKSFKKAVREDEDEIVTEEIKEASNIKEIKAAKPKAKSAKIAKPKATKSTKAATKTTSKSAKATTKKDTATKSKTKKA